MTRILIFFSIIFTSLILPVTSFAQTGWASQPNDTRCTGSYYGISAASDVASIQGLECLFYNILQVIAALAGIAFFFMFISGGFKYLFSGGDEKKVAAASSALTMAVIGLVGVIVSWFILQLITKFTGVNVTLFRIPG